MKKKETASGGNINNNRGNQCSVINQIKIKQMETNNNDALVLNKVKKQVKEMKIFYTHLMAYVLVMVILMTINLITYPFYLWFLWPVLGWGIPIAFHGLAVFNMTPFLGRDWEERKIEELMEKEKDSKWL